VIRVSSERLVNGLTVRDHRQTSAETVVLMRRNIDL
jgi:hypothetical protein